MCKNAVPQSICVNDRTELASPNPSLLQPPSWHLYHHTLPLLGGKLTLPSLLTTVVPLRSLEGNISPGFIKWRNNQIRKVILLHRLLMVI